jgi:hypothetical protein
VAKSLAAEAVGRAYQALGVLSAGRLFETAAAELRGRTITETRQLVGEATTRASGSVLLITSTHVLAELGADCQQVLRALHGHLTETRAPLRDDLVVILAGYAGPLRSLLDANPALATRFPAVINFPGYTTTELPAFHS